MLKLKKTYKLKRFVLFLGFLFTYVQYSWAETACSNVALEIMQEATTERTAFDAKLVLTNNIPDKDLTGLRVDVTIKDTDGNIRNDLFYMRVSSTRNISAVDGTGTVAAGSSAEVHWLIIPSVGAGGDGEGGIKYSVGASLVYSISGKQEILSVNPDIITVKPMPQIVLDYFMPRNVIADNPFTSQVEAPIPFILGLRVFNNGSGEARKLKIDSAQPKITANEQGLLVDFKLLGASVNNMAVTPSLTVDMGDLGSKKIAAANWEMISTLTGTFVEFDVSFSHASELGGELTSLITETNAHYLVHQIQVDLPGRDTLLDFLADTDGDAEHLPDMIYESEIPGGSTDMADSISSIQRAALLSQPSRPTESSPSVVVQLQDGISGWVFAKFEDPSKGMLELLDIVRNDGVRLNDNNFWIEKGVDSDYRTTNTAWIVDYLEEAAASTAYTMNFSQPAADVNPPVTNINFDGPSIGTSPVFIDPSTKIFFTALDNDGGSGVDGIFKKHVGNDQDFVAAYPFLIDVPGTHTIDYYSSDRAGNTEASNSATIIIDSSSPVISSFQSVPATFMPHAPNGVSVAKETSFVASVSDSVGSLPFTIEIANSNDFSAGSIVKTLVDSLESGLESRTGWDGKNNSGSLVPSGTYYAKLTVTDGLGNASAGHSSSAVTTVVVADWFSGTPLDPNLSGEQMYPDISITHAVWQDNRNGNWDVYSKGLSGGAGQQLTVNTADQIRPQIDGNTIVWQDLRNGNWDIYGYDTATGQELVIYTGAGNQERPSIAGDWAAWQDSSGGNWDIYAKNLATGEVLQVTQHERDQINPSVTGGALYWEDYRHGLGEIYKYDLISRIETRVTVSQANQTTPAAAGSLIVWTDQRNAGSGKDIYLYDTSAGERRITYGDWDERGPRLHGNMLVYVDDESGSSNPDISFYDLSAGYGGKLIASPSVQDEPALAADYLLWQDDRDGVYQIYGAALSIAPSNISVEYRPGFNLVAAGEKLAQDYATASALLNEYGQIEKLIAFSNAHGMYLEAVRAGDDFNIQQGMALAVYATTAGKLDVAASGESVQYTLLPGENQIGLLTIPAAYSAYALVNSIGLDNVRSLRRFDAVTGRWQTVAVREKEGVKEIAGVNFTIIPGDGLIINMSNRVDGWKP
ncbi:hypothetical protein BAC1_00449 [uncultured bacterium]|nr:hypothetical protein BAC1_00449 [uncultured bacterium]